MSLLLVVEDRQALRDLYVSFLKGLGHQVVQAESAEDALKILVHEQVDLTLCDYMLPGLNGLELVSQVRSKGIDTIIIIMTAFGEVKLAVSCIQNGAYDFLEKPIDLDYLEVVVNKALEHRSLQNQADLSQNQKTQSGKKIIGASQAILEVIQVVDKVAPTSTTCLLLGESGTGKELLAERLHLHSTFNQGPFVTINCASIPSELLESELFGHEKGAFTGAISRKKGLFELAQNGTIFLDEIGELPLDLQPKLLRVIQDKTFRTVGGTRMHRANIRFVCATNRDLHMEVRQGRFREDLFFRISVFPIEIPPLREHLEDLDDLVAHFLACNGSARTAMDSKALSILKRYTWPGNIRELENVIERAVILAKGGDIQVHHLPSNLESDSLTVRLHLNLDQDLKTNQDEASRQLEKTMIHTLWSRYKGNRKRIAEHMGISSKTLVLRIETHFPDGMDPR